MNPRRGVIRILQLLPRERFEAIELIRFETKLGEKLLGTARRILACRTTHLRAALSQYNNLPRALAAYNAGASRVTRWARRAGARDPEIFIERIPFVETRDYVRIVMRNAEMYRALYELR